MKRKRPSNHPMLKTGITGGIGSGKTTVCKLFEQLGIPVYHADERAKYLMQHEHFLIDRIKECFGEQAYLDGSLNRKYISDIVFTDKEKLAQLNSLVHPAVYRDTERWFEEQREKKAPYALNEAALLVETGSYKKMDKLIVVTAPLQLRVSRVKERDSADEEDVLSRIKNQLPEEDKVKIADFVIANDSDLEHLKNQVMETHLALLRIDAEVSR